MATVASIRHIGFLHSTPMRPPAMFEYPQDVELNPWDDCSTQDLGSNMESYQETHVFEHVDF